ncbi:MAG: replication-relaxation family protein [Thalassobaculum sp.]|uniref:replication-relaxation family protein n=1 Tax=Thalassobaculum sp. TaxID=2022740 RepID=UPI0032F057FC
MNLTAITPRTRDVPRTTGRRVTLTPRDLVWFEMLHRHGALPITYLYQFTKDQFRSLDAAKNRATPLFHEANTPHNGQYLSRPGQQWATLSPNAMQHELVHELRPAAERALKDAGLWRERAPQPSPSHWHHDFMVSCFTASVHLATLGTEYGYVFQDEILDRAVATMTFDVGERRSAKEIPLRPDRMFGIRYPSGKVRVFILEADRATETLRSTLPRKTIERNVRQYRAFIGGGLYKDALKLSGGVLVIYATTARDRMRNIQEVIAEGSPGGRNAYSLTTYLPEFGPYTRPPAVMPRLFTDPYERVGHEPFMISISG